MSASSAAPSSLATHWHPACPVDTYPCPFFAAGWLPCISSSRTGSCPSRRTHGRDHYPGVHRVSRRLCGDSLLFDSKRKRAAGPPPDLPCSLPRAHTHADEDLRTGTYNQKHVSLLSTSPPNNNHRSWGPPPPPPWPCEFVPVGHTLAPNLPTRPTHSLAPPAVPQCTLLQG